MSFREFGNTNTEADAAMDAALFGSNESSENIAAKVVRLKLSEIWPDPNQPRRSPEKIDEMAFSLAHEGQISPIKVQEVNHDHKNVKYELVVGERRYWGAIQNKWETIEAIVIDVPDAEAKLSLQVAENVDREDFSLADVCQAIARYKDEFNRTHDYIAKNHFLSPSKGNEKWVGERYRLWDKAKKQNDLKALLADYRDVLSHAQLIVQVEDFGWRTRMITAVREGASVADIRKIKQDADADAELKDILAGKVPTASAHRNPTTQPEQKKEPEPVSRQKREPLTNEQRAEFESAFDAFDEPEYSEQSVNNSLLGIKSSLDSIGRQMPLALESKTLTPLAREALKKQLKTIENEARKYRAMLSGHIVKEDAGES